MGGADGGFPDRDQTFKVCGECGFNFHGADHDWKTELFQATLCGLFPLTLTLSLREREQIELTPNLHHRVHPIFRHHHGDVFHRHARREVNILQLL
ncbi:hypothetical protein OUHCRE19_26480 [Enterobacter asburiae]